LQQEKLGFVPFTGNFGSDTITNKRELLHGGYILLHLPGELQRVIPGVKKRYILLQDRRKKSHLGRWPSGDGP